MYTQLSPWFEVTIWCSHWFYFNLLLAVSQTVAVQTLGTLASQRFSSFHWLEAPWSSYLSELLAFHP